MRLVLFDDYRVGVVRGGSLDRVVDVSGAIDPALGSPPGLSMNRVIAGWESLRGNVEELARKGQDRPLAGVKLLPPVPNPSKILITGNYSSHIAEMRDQARAWVKPGGDLPREGIRYNLKSPSALIGPTDQIMLPAELAQRRIDHEAELAFVVGRRAADVPSERAREHIFGYTVFLDISLRGNEPVSLRKSFDTFAVMGPWLVTADEIPDPQRLAIRLWRNGELRQDGGTWQMDYPVDDLLSFASTMLTLYPGDVFSTGTPAGVGPIEDGDTLAAEVERVGRLEVKVGTRTTSRARWLRELAQA